MPVDETSDDAATRAERYSAWAQRLQEKRSRVKEAMVTASGGEGPRVDPRWTSEQVYLESDRVARRELSRTRDPFVIAELLQTLGLDSSASPEDVERAYRQLAKLHHPDFHVDDDEAVRAHHAEQMQRVNDAYEALSQLDSFT